MTTSVSTRATGTLNPTRQQLDELDALLQRMLELPVHPLEEPEPTESVEADEEPPSSLHHQPSVTSSPPLFGGQEETDSGQEEESEQRITDSRHRSEIPHVSYMVVETASPRPLPPASGFEPRPPLLTPRLLPVSPTAETPAPPIQIRETPVPPPMAEAGDSEMWVPLRSTWQPSAQTWPPVAESWHQVNGGAPTHTSVPNLISSPRPDLSQSKVVAQKQAEQQSQRDEPEPSPTTADETAVPATPTPAARAAESRLILSAEDAPVTVPLQLLPLLWFNQGFDACLAPLGVPGRWLCGGGRSLLGWIGLVCLAAAVALAVLTGMGWTW